MNALLNAHTKRGCDSPPHIGFASNVSPEAQSSQTGVSSEYVQQEGYNWFVLRATYNRVNAAVEKAKKNDIKTYVPMHYVLKVIAGKKKRIQQPLLPNFLFIYATREQSDSFVKKTVDAPISFIPNSAHNPRDSGNQVCRFRVHQWEFPSLTALP